MMGVGVDFGTSNSTVAWFDGAELRFVRLEAAGPILPTAIHLSKEYVGSTGTDAIERYVRENTARLVHLVPEIVGQAAGEISDRTTDSAMSELETSRRFVYGPLTDRGLPGRLFLGLKRLLGNPAVDRIDVFERPYRLVALLTPILLRMREGAERALNGAVGSVHVGRPVDFEGEGPGRNALALRRLGEACRHAGFHDIEFYPEPVAATVSFLQRRASPAAGTVLTVDFGGGTLDLSIVRHAGTEFRVLATAGADLGGDRIDQMIFRHMLFPMMGEGERWVRQVDGRRIETRFPFQEYEEGVLNWAITHTLNQNRYKTRLNDAIVQGGPAAAKFQRLKDLINYNYGYQAFSAIKRAKAALSAAAATTIDVPELNLNLPFTRAQLDHLLEPVLARIDSLLREVMTRALLHPGEVDVVVRTGGSSQIVAVRELLEGHFPGRVIEHDPFHGVAGGLAIASFHGHRAAAAS